MILSQKFSCDCFSKISRIFYAGTKSWIIVVFLQRTLYEIVPIFLINTLLLYIPLIDLTHRQNDWQRNKYTRCAWAGGTFFPVALLCQFFVLVGNRFWFYIPSETVLCPILWGINYHIFMPVRLDEILNSIVDTCLKFVYVYQKQFGIVNTYFFLIMSTLKGDLLVKIFHFTFFLFWPYVKIGEYCIEFVCRNVIF